MIKEMKESDLDEVLEIENEAFTHPWTKEQFLYELNENDLSEAYVLKEDEKIIGYALMWYLFENTDLTNIAVKKEYQNKGYGKELLRFMIKRAIQNDIEFMHLEVRTTNDVAINLYESFGFEKVRIRKNYYEDGNDAYDMVKALGGLSEEDFSA